jgi:hypothetical protein
MTSRRIRFLFRGLALLLLFTVSSTIVSSSLAQDLSDDLPGVDDTVPVPPVDEPITNPPNEEEAAVEPAVFLAAPAALMNYQGVLKDADGRRLTGVYDMVFRLFTAAPTGGTKVWGDETHTDVPVDDGLFAVVLGETLAFDVYSDFDRQLYLEVVVDGVVLPRQPLRAVPYALGLLPGATIRGSTPSIGQYGLDIRNGGGRGLFADGVGDDIYSIYSADVTYSDEGYAGPDTYIWLPGASAVLKYTSLSFARIEVETYGNAKVVSTIPGGGAVDIEIPIAWQRPYGRDYAVVGVRVYYEAQGADGFITSSWLLGRNILTGATVALVTDGTDQTSTDYDDYSLAIPTAIAITEANTPTNVQLRADLDALGDFVQIYAVRLHLRSRL